MVKPDVKVNYYAALEVGPDASVDDCKKAYRKLALKWHPDRNRGNEDEAATKFQAIAAANEVLGDPTSKAKYDTDRRRANLSGPPPRAAGQRGNPYADAASAFAPPPRRTADPTRNADTSSWNRPAGSRTGSSTATGADRFANFPKPGPTSRTPEAARATAAEAWTFMGGGKQKGATGSSSAPHAPPQANTNAQRRQAPPVPPREAPAQASRPPNLPKRDNDPRSARGAASRASYASNSAYDHFNSGAASGSAQRPNVNRSSTTSSQTPRKSGYNPNAPGSDERPTSGPSNYNTSHIKSPDYQPSPSFAPTSPPPSASGSPGPSRAVPDPRVPFPQRASTYAQSSGEKLHIDPQIRRTQSVRDAKFRNIPPSPLGSNSRHHSNSPPRSGNGRTMSASSFHVNTDSDATSSDSSATSDAAESSSQPFSKTSRPVKKATGARSRPNGAPPPVDTSFQTAPQSRRASHAGPSRKNSMSGSSAQPGGPSGTPMYDQPFSSFEDKDSPFAQHNEASPARHAQSSSIPSSSEKPAPAARRAMFPDWAIPTSVLVNAAGKQDIPQGDFQQAEWEYVQDPPLIDVVHEVEPRVGCHPCCTTHCVAHDQSTYERDMELLAKDMFGFASNYNFAANDQAKSKSNEDINTNFSPTAPNFASIPGAKQSSPSITRRNSPTKQARSTLSAQPSRHNVTQRVSFEGVRDQGRTPTSPGLFGEVTAQQGPSTAQSPFSPDQWHGKHFFGDGSNVQESSSRRGSGNGGFKVPLTPHPRGTFESNEERDSDAQTSTNSGDAMDIDPPTAEPGQKTARPYNVPPSAWRISQGGPNPSANHGRRRSSLRTPTEQNHQLNGSKTTAGDIPSLQPLGASLNGGANTSQGSYDMTNLQGSVPFTSKASSVHPSRLMAEPPPPPPPSATSQQHPGSASSPRIATPNSIPAPSAAAAATPKYPNYPVGPPQPQKWTRASFIEYTRVMHEYINAMHVLRVYLASRNADALQAEDMLLGLGPVGLQAQGEIGFTGIEAFERRLRDEDGWKEYERVILEGYRAAIAAYVRAKEQVRRLAEAGALAD